MRSLLCLVVLSLVAWCQPVPQLIQVESFPPGAKVYLETSSGPVFVGTSGQKCSIVPPGSLDLAGKRVQYFSGYLTLEAPDHHKLRVPVASEEWALGRLPAQGSYSLVADNLLVWLFDYARVYPVWVGAAGLAAAAALVGLWRGRSQSRRQGALLRTLQDRLETAGDPMIGKTLGEFEVLSRLGQGGMGTVYRVRGPQGVECAAKVIFRDPNNPLFEARFRREVKVTSQLHHPNLVQVLDYGEQPGLIYYVMELIGGRTLSSRVVAGGLSWPEAWSLLKPVLEGLIFAHSQGVVHRDLKPSNLMVSDQGQVKILDFGLARDRELSAITQTGGCMGTPTYVAPEQLGAGSREVEPRTDQYSFGVVLFELLTGRPPFESDDPQELLTMHLFRNPPRLNTLRPDLPLALDRLIQRVLSKDVSRRFPSCLELMDALDSLPKDGSSAEAKASISGPSDEATVDLNVKRHSERP